MVGNPVLAISVVQLRLDETLHLTGASLGRQRKRDVKSVYLIADDYFHNPAMMDVIDLKSDSIDFIFYILKGLNLYT